MPRLLMPDVLTRQVLFAVELADPVAQRPVFRGATVTAVGLTGVPLVNWSGRFVWLAEGERWPERVVVAPGDLPFAAEDVPAPPRPADPTGGPADQRLLRIVLRPTAAYDFGEGVTAVRGCLRERGERTSPPVPGARVQLAWRDADGGQWRPTPGPREPETDGRGEFATYLRLGRSPIQRPDSAGGLLKVRLQVTRRSPGPVTRVTPEDFPFLPDGPAGRVPEGRLLPRDLQLGWEQLQEPGEP
jgi:hypothetical protein